MKRVLLTALTVMMLATLAACAPATQAPKLTEKPAEVKPVEAAKPTEKPAEAAKPVEVTKPAEAPKPTEAAPKADALPDLGGREVKVAIENAYLPFNYIEIKTGQAGGLDYDVWNEICARIKCKPSFVETSWESMIPAVAGKQFDTGADGISITDERKQVVDFSIGIISVDQRLLVRMDESRFKNMADFKADAKLKLGTQTGTTNYETARKFLPEDRIVAFEQFSFAVQALLSKDVDAVLSDETAGQGYLGENKDKVQLIGEPISSDKIGYIFPKGSDLVSPVNKALEAMMKDGTISALSTKYFGSNFKLTWDDIRPAPTATPAK